MSTFEFKPPPAPDLFEESQTIFAPDRYFHPNRGHAGLDQHDFPEHHHDMQSGNHSIQDMMDQSSHPMFEFGTTFDYQFNFVAPTESSSRVSASFDLSLFGRDAFQDHATPWPGNGSALSYCFNEIDRFPQTSSVDALLAHPDPELGQQAMSASSGNQTSLAVIGPSHKNLSSNGHDDTFSQCGLPSAVDPKLTWSGGSMFPAPAQEPQVEPPPLPHQAQSVLFGTDTETLVPAIRDPLDDLGCIHSWTEDENCKNVESSDCNMFAPLAHTGCCRASQIQGHSDLEFEKDLTQIRADAARSKIANSVAGSADSRNGSAQDLIFVPHEMALQSTASTKPLAVQPLSGSSSRVGKGGKRGKRTNSSEHKHKCSECKFSSKLRKDWIRHLEGVHHKVKHLCPHCGRGISRLDGLVRHLNNRSLHTELHANGIDPLAALRAVSGSATQTPPAADT